MYYHLIVEFESLFSLIRNICLVRINEMVQYKCMLNLCLIGMVKPLMHLQARSQKSARDIYTLQRQNDYFM